MQKLIVSLAVLVALFNGCEGLKLKASISDSNTPPTESDGTWTKESNPPTHATASVSYNGNTDSTDEDASP